MESIVFYVSPLVFKKHFDPEGKMGLFKIEIEAFGSHGCDRSTKDGEKIPLNTAQQGATANGRCGSPSCIDCVAHNLVALLLAKGYDVRKATFAHWPDAENIVDDLVSKVRKGTFQPAPPPPKAA